LEAILGFTRSRRYIHKKASAIQEYYDTTEESTLTRNLKKTV